MKALILAVLILAAALAVRSQATGCPNAPKDFDFWVGEWDLAWVQGGKEGTGRTRISKVLDGCAILEEFDGTPGSPLVGRSYSVFDANAKAWKQTWVDNQGSYLDFHGGMADGRMVLAREVKRADKVIQQRMVFQDVQADRLKWLWQGSSDGGKTWTTAWEIDYKRRR